MYSEKMFELGSRRSVIREIFEFGKKRIAQVGAEKVFDFSLGNPNVPAPQAVEDTILELLRTMDPASSTATPAPRETPACGNRSRQR